MIEFPELFEQAFETYGLVGLVIAFLVLGPGFTYIRTRQAQLHADVKAQTLLNRFARDEHEQVERLEQRLDDALGRLEVEREEVMQLRVSLFEAQRELLEMPQLREQVLTLTQRVCDLEGQVEASRTENERLQQENERKESRIFELERVLVQGFGPRTTQQGEDTTD